MTFLSQNRCFGVEMSLPDALVGESESDDEGAAAVNSPEGAAAVNSPRPPCQNASSAAGNTFTEGSSSTAQPLTDTGTSYDDIDTDNPLPMLGGSAEPGDSSNSSAWHKHGNSAADTTSPQLDSHNMETQQSVDHSSAASDAHTQDMTALSQQPVHADALHNHMAQQGTEGHTSSSSAAATATTSEAAGHGEGQEVGPPGIPGGIPGVGGPTLASNLAFQQELQQRSGERQARAGAVMSDASAREVSDRGNSESEAAQRSLR